MSKDLKTILLGLVLASIWGYFSDLKNGEVGTFVGRLIFVPLFMLIAERLVKAKK